MEVQQIQELVVCSTAAATGVLMAFVSPSHLPEPLKSLSERFGGYRKAIGIAIVLIALLLIAT